jgi:hypothetical protein
VIHQLEYPIRPVVLVDGDGNVTSSGTSVFTVNTFIPVKYDSIVQTWTGNNLTKAVCRLAGTTVYTIDFTYQEFGGVSQLVYALGY